MNPRDLNQFAMPVPAYPGGAAPGYGPYYAGGHVNNPTTSPYLNMAFRNVNAMQDMSYAIGAMQTQSAMDPNLAFANGVVNPALQNAYNLYKGQPNAGAAPEGSKAASTVKGVVGGAAVGAVVGSLIPVVGTALGAGIGAVVGGIMGFFKP